MEDTLPEHVMFDILSRLPVKTVIYCKCVCKKWRDLVSDPYFVHRHHKRSSQCLLIQHGLLLECGDIEHQYVVYQRLTVNHVKSLNLNFCRGVCGYPTIQAGSVNGLICVCHPCYPPYIFNPVVGEYMFIVAPRSCLVSLGYGFGVSTAGQYKVIHICSRKTTLNPYGAYSYTVEINVYTLGSWQWRSLGQAPYHLNISGPLRHGLFLNGHVYWLRDGQIYDFDLNAETFKLFPSPPAQGDNKELKQMLGVLKGSLSLFSWSSLGFKVWVMKESWYKESAMIQEDINPFLRSQGWRPLCLVDGLEGTSILIIRVKVTETVVAYCLNTNTILDINLSHYIRRVMTYRPSFLKLQNVGSECVYSIVKQ